MMLEILKYWKLIVFAFIATISFCTVFGLHCYYKGQNSIWKKLGETPVKVTVDWKQAQTQPSEPIIKWLKPETIQETPQEVLAAIDSMGADIERYKKLLAEKAKPFSSQFDSSFAVQQQFADSAVKEITIPFSLSIITQPWSRKNKVELRLKPFTIPYPEITKSRTIVKDAPWWSEPCSVVGTGLLVYGIARENYTLAGIGGGLLVVRIIL